MPDKIFINEQWFPLSTNFIPNIIPNVYEISTWGRIYNNITGKYYPNENNNYESYINVYLRLQNNELMEYPLHKLVAFVFLGNPENDSLVVNHKDGIKYHNWIWNLEYITSSENSIHALDNNLARYGENVKSSIITNGQANMIAECLTKGLKPKEISIQLQNEFVGIDPRSIALLAQAMANGMAWRRTRDQFDMSNCYCTPTLERKCPFTDEQIHSMCKFMEEKGTTNIPYRRLLDVANFYYGDIINSNRDMQKLSAHVSLIKKKEIRKDICNQYNYQYTFNDYPEKE